MENKLYHVIALYEDGSSISLPRMNAKETLAYLSLSIEYTCSMDDLRETESDIMFRIFEDNPTHFIHSVILHKDGSIEGYPDVTVPKRFFGRN